MKKIIFGITSLTIGGAERVLVDLANRLSEEYSVTIFTIYDGGELKNELNSNIKKIALYRKPYKDLSKFQKLKASLKLIFYRRKIYEAIMRRGFDAEIAFLEGPVTRLFGANLNNKLVNTKFFRASLNNKIANKNVNTDQNTANTRNNIEKLNTKIAWIHNDISKVYGSGIKAKIKKWVDGKLYKKYDKLVFVSKENQKDFNKEYKWANESNEEVIRNYIDYKKVLDKANEKVDLPYDNKEINLLTVCRLVEQKALDRFIKEQKELENKGIHVKIYIVGDGPQRYNLQKQIDEEGLTNRFILLGQKENPYPYIKYCDYFCLLSYYEGYGMVLEEAKILNKPIILTNTAAIECVQGYDKAIVLENNFEGIVKGLEKELKSDNVKYLETMQDYKLENNYNELQKTNEEIQEKIIRKIKNIL